MLFSDWMIRLWYSHIMGNKRNALLMHTILCMNLQGIIMIKNQSPKVRSLFRLYNPFHLYNLFKHGKIIELDNRLVTVRAREGTGCWVGRKMHVAIKSNRRDLWWNCFVFWLVMDTWIYTWWNYIKYTHEYRGNLSKISGLSILICQLCYCSIVCKVLALDERYMGNFYIISYNSK